MAFRTVKRLFRYGTAKVNHEFDKRADPVIQIEQAIGAAQQRHADLAKSAGKIAGEVRKLEMRAARKQQQIDDAVATISQALQLAEAEPENAEAYETAATRTGESLLTYRRELSDIQILRTQTANQAERAKEMVKESAEKMREIASEKSRLMSQIEATKMQESVSRTMAETAGLMAGDDTPTLTSVREKIEGRYAVAMGNAEVAEAVGVDDAVQAKVKKAAVNSGARDAVAEIRKSLQAEGKLALPPGEKTVSVMQVDLAKERA